MKSRQTELAKIHIGAKQLGLSKDDGDPENGKLSSYESMLWTVARVHSSADLDEFGRKKIIDYMIKCGVKFRPKKKQHKGVPNNLNRVAYLQKIEAQLADMKLPWSYAEKIAYNITGGKGEHQEQPGIKKLDWIKKAKHFDAIIAALYNEQQKRGLLATIEELLKQQGKDKSYVDEMAKRKNWQRHIPSLKTIVDHLANLND